MIQEKYFAVGGLKGRALLTSRSQVLGPGPSLPVIILPGWGCAAEVVRPLQQQLAAEFDTVAIDLPGFGKSEKPEAVWSTRDYAAWVNGAMESLGIRKAHFCGHSHGGRVALVVAAENPALVEKLVLVGAAGIPVKNRSLKYFGKVLVAKLGKIVARWGGRLGKRLKEKVYRYIASPDYQNAGPLRSTFVKVIREDFSGLLSEITAPTLLIWGVNDDATPVSVAQVFAQRIAHSELVLIEDAGHYVFVDKPVQVGTAIKRFLRVSIPC